MKTHKPTDESYKRHMNKTHDPRDTAARLKVYPIEMYRLQTVKLLYFTPQIGCE